MSLIKNITMHCQNININIITFLLFKHEILIANKYIKVIKKNYYIKIIYINQ